MTKQSDILDQKSKNQLTSISSDALALEHTLIRTLMLLRDAQPRVLKAGGVSRTFYKKLASALGENTTPAGMDEEDFHAFLVATLISCELTSEAEGKLTDSASHCEAFFNYEPTHRLELLREAWLSSELLNEFLSISSLQIPGARTSQTVNRADHVPGSKRLKEIRRRVVELVENQPLGEWVTIDALLDQAEEELNDLLITADNSPVANSTTYLGIRLNDARMDLVRDGNWRKVEGALIEELLRVPLFLLGYVDLGLKEDDGEQHVTAIRRRRVAREDRKTPVSEQPLLIQGNFEVTALLPEMSLGSLWKLTRLADVTAFEQVAHFTIEERLVATEVNSGRALEGICDFLESHSKTGLPQNVRYTLGEWVKRTERITIYTDAYLFQAEGVEKIDTLVSEAYRKRGELFTVGEKHLVGSAQALPEPREGIAARYPVLDYSRQLPPVVTAQPSGLLACEPEQVNFRVMQALARIADQLSIERWQLTRESVQAALKKGMPLDKLISLLQSVLRNDLPPLLRARLMVWGERFGSAAVGDIRVLSFERGESAQLLRHDPRFAELLSAPLNPTTFLLTKEDEADVRHAIADLQLELEEGVKQTHGGRDSSGPVQIASVRTSPARADQNFDAQRFSRSWETGHRDNALDYAVASGVRLVALVQLEQDAAPKRVHLEPVRWVGFDGGGYLEARIDSRDIRVLSLASIFEAELL